VKRVTAVIEIFARIREAVPTRLLMVGDGPEMDAAADLAQALGVAADVEFLGEQDQVAAILSLADAFLLPSEQESFGLAALEAMACGVPVVASRVGGLPEVIEHGVTGFLHPLGDLEGMAQSAVRLLTDEHLREAMAAASRQRASQRYCDDRIVPLYEQYYEEILEVPRQLEPGSVG
jgi:N-acetyl-alpha-D-glucosaminyl L-malate synthase BshA